MKPVSTSVRTLVLALGLSVGIGAVSTIVPDTALAADKADKGDKAQKVGEKVGKPLQAAADAIKAKQFDQAAQKLKEAEQAPKITPFEQFKINEITAYMYVAQQKYGEAAAIYEKYLDT